MALVERRGVPLCEASVRNESLFERSEFFRLASKHPSGSARNVSLDFLLHTFLVSRQEKYVGVWGRQPHFFFNAEYIGKHIITR